MNINAPVNLDEIREKILELLDIADRRDIRLDEIKTTLMSVEGIEVGGHLKIIKEKISQNVNIEALKKLYKKLRFLVDGHILFDDKIIKIYEVSNKLKLIKNALEYLFNNYKQDYKAENEVNEALFFPRKCLKINENVLIFQFKQIRELTVKKEIPRNSLKDNIEEDYKQVFGMKRIELDCYDSILIDLENNLFIVMVDLATVMPNSLDNLVLNNFEKYLRASLAEHINLSEIIDKPCNLFSCIQQFYDEPKDSSNGVTSLYFTTSEGTSHSEKLKGEWKDLREATYHKGGVYSLKNTTYNDVKLNETITPYRITKRYYNMNVDISIKGNIRHISSASRPELYSALAERARSYDSMKFIIDKILQLR